MAIIGKINDKVLIDDLVLREEPEVLTRWQDPTIKEQQKEIERLTAESTEWESKCYKYQNIIDELEKYINKMIKEDSKYNDVASRYGVLNCKNILDKLKELKEGK